MYRYYLALRFILSRPINLLGMIGVMLGVWALIVVVSIFDGYKEELQSHFTMTASDLVVYRLGNQARFEDVRKIIEADSNVTACAPRLVWHGLLHPRNASELRVWIPGAIEKQGRYVTILGIDPKRESDTTGFAGWIAAADEDLRVDLNQLATDDNWILVSNRKAKTKGKELRIGDTLTISTARVHYHRGGNSTQFETAQFRVAGAYKTQHAGFDNLTTLVSIDALRKVISSANSEFLNEVAVKLESTTPQAIEETRTRLDDALAAAPEFRLSPPSVLIAGQEERGFIQAIVHQSGLMKLVLFVIMVVAGFLIYATLSMMVTEKKHDIGVLSALGGSRAGVLQVFLSCGFAITLIGTILGLLTGCLTAVYLNDFNEWLKRTFGIDLFPSDIYNLPGVPYELDPGWMLIVVASSLVLGLVVSFLPAQRAMRNDPLQCLRDT